MSGSSGYFLGGVVAYSNEVKERLLKVPHEILVTEGAVSEACALAMARGVLEAVGAQVGVSTTGIAGPTGSTETKPVGLTHVALAASDYQRCERYVFSGDRLQNIEATAQATLQILKEYLMRLGRTG
ncbi:MAG: CinA family protein [Chloroflexi bacterium]|nr:CinA family protein [Chloroflexota bacterium]